MGKSNQFCTRYRKTAEIIIFLLLVNIVAVCGGAFVYAQPSDIKASSSSSSIVIEASSLRVLNGENIYRRMEPASTTKILTAITVIENCNVYESIEIPDEAEGVEGSSVYLKKGERWRITDLLYGLMLRSGNDCAVALAIATSGSVQSFVKLMNQVAFKAGAYSSNFSNPHGLPADSHYTTAYDLALITAYASHNDLFTEICQTERYYFTLNGENRYFTNKNKLLYSYEGANGYKTGYTKRAGRCLVSGAKRDGMQLIAVVLNEGNMWNRSIELLENSFTDYTLTLIQEKDTPIAVNVNGSIRTMAISRDIYYPLTKGERGKVKIDYLIDRGVNNNGVQGYMTVSLENNLIFSEKLYRI